MVRILTQYVKEQNRDDWKDEKLVAAENREADR
jgi:hypothetical protein